MSVRYHQRGGQRIVPDYLCQHKRIEQGEHPCQRIPGSGLDRAIGALLLERVTPEALALTIAVQEELVNRDRASAYADVWIPNGFCRTFQKDLQ